MSKNFRGTKSEIMDIYESNPLEKTPYTKINKSSKNPRKQRILNKLMYGSNGIYETTKISFKYRK